MKTVTNREWRRSRDPATMIEGLRDVASSRKSILYLCGGGRFLWGLLFDDWSKQSIEVAERFADGLATEEELGRAHYAAECPTFGYDFEPIVWREWGGVPDSVLSLVKMGVLTEAQLLEDRPDVDPVLRDRLLAAASLAEAASSRDPFRQDWWHDSLRRVDWPGDWLLRCVFGKPFHPPVVLDPTWMTPDVVDLAGSIYAERAFDRMPYLGDALEDAGCGHRDILNHCRAERTHVRGCWVVDSILGKS